MLEITISEQAGISVFLLLLEVALAGQQSLRLGWGLLCSSGPVIAMSGAPAPDKAEAAST